jgi:hypothetical protein
MREEWKVGREKERGSKRDNTLVAQHVRIWTKIIKKKEKHEKQ